MKKYDELLKATVISIDQTLFELVEKKINNDVEKIKFMQLVYLNLLGNNVLHTSKPEFLAENFGNMKQAFAEIATDYLRKTNEDKVKEAH